ncbi:MAG: hypothetical protein ACQEQT_07675 [Chloroflexota bacterium]
MESQALEELPDFKRTRFVPVHRTEFTGPDQAGYAPPFYWYPPTGQAWGTAAEETVGTSAPTVPASWISLVMEDEVHLEVTSETLQDLPEHELGE